MKETHIATSLYRHALTRDTTIVFVYKDLNNDLQLLGDQSDLGGLHPADLYVMQYLTITEDAALLDKLLEIEALTQQALKDATRRFETAERTKKTLFRFCCYGSVY
jgi:hypothetical protein